MRYKKFAAVAGAVAALIVGAGASPATAQSNGECTWGAYVGDSTVAYCNTSEGHSQFRAVAICQDDLSGDTFLFYGPWKWTYEPYPSYAYCNSSTFLLGASYRIK
ncbi:hypothetical protein SAMN05216252_14830 [Actinacidiphila glaucinigra]|uniref:Uncharacterized protein n=1 Tax=Actinacidiphila glaucinigra TaxID=235986 RepID=A0A239NTY3_9ACTN|nr:hypothetical protein SAMN05216252_14830 [Actinacidiphila glaucinigra]